MHAGASGSTAGALSALKASFAACALAKCSSVGGSGVSSGALADLTCILQRRFETDVELSIENTRIVHCHISIVKKHNNCIDRPNQFLSIMLVNIYLTMESNKL